MKRMFSFVGMLQVASLALLVPAAMARAAQTPDSASISKLFQQARNHAALANDGSAGDHDNALARHESSPSHNC